jgi:DnaJ-class molecular chaperone
MDIDFFLLEIEAAQFKEISIAYEVLTDQRKRELYDAYGEEGPSFSAFF